MLRRTFVLLVLGSLPAAAQTLSTQQAAPTLMMNDLRVVTQVSRPNVWKVGDPVTVIQDLRGTGGNPRTGPNPPINPAPLPYGSPIAPPLLNAAFEGIPSTGVLPSGVSGDVGHDHYLQVVNGAFAFYSKTGDLVAGPLALQALWLSGTPCAVPAGGGMQTRYDHLAKRWVISRYALPANASPHICMAVSRTADPIVGGWNLYTFSTGGVYPGAPKLALSVDGYAMTSYRGTADAGSDVWMFERTQMLAGLPAQMVRIGVAHPVPFLPGDIEPLDTGPGGPFAWGGFGNLFVRLIDGERFGGSDRLELYLFNVYWNAPTGSTFVLRKSIPVQAPFDSIVCTNSLMDPCVAQPGTTMQLGALSAFASGRAQRLMRPHAEKLLLSQTINVNGRPEVRWYDVQRTWKTQQVDWRVLDWGTHADDALSRWNGSVAMDTTDDLAFAFHAASVSVFPSIRIGVRRQGQPWATLTRETTLVAGGGSQTDRPRWGAASSLELDPQNDCTFWFTGEYYTATSAAGWRTRIVSFTHPNCHGSTNGSFVVTKQPDGGFGQWASSSGARAYIGDFDGDHKSDILLLGSSSFSTVPIAFSNGDGTFRIVNVASPLAARAAQGRVLVGDINGDQKSDIVIVGGSGWDKIVTGRSRGDGGFDVVEFKHANFATWASQANQVLGDFDNDGKADILLIGPAWGSIPMAFSNGDGTFRITNEKVALFTQWASTKGVRPYVGDFDGDGLDDVTLTGASSWTTLPVAFSNGNGTFTVTNEVVDTMTFNGIATSFPAWAAQPNARVFAGSVLGTAKTSLVVTGPPTLKGIVLCSPDYQVRGKFHTYVRGNMADPFGTYSSVGATKTLAADFSGDGKLDVALLGLSVFTTIPTAFGETTSFGVTNAALLQFQAWSAYALPLPGDFDGNGRMDIVLVSISGATTLPVAFSIW